MAPEEKIMGHYIDKDTIVAELKKRYEFWREKEFNSHSIESEIRMSECQHLMLLINTLEVKEVDLEKKDIKNAFKAGFELGIQHAQKGE